MIRAGSQSLAFFLTKQEGEVTSHTSQNRRQNEEPRPQTPIFLKLTHCSTHNVTNWLKWNEAPFIRLIFFFPGPVFWRDACTEGCVLWLQLVPYLLTVEDFFPQIRTKTLTQLGKDEQLNTLQSALVELSFICSLVQKDRIRINLYSSLSCLRFGYIWAASLILWCMR